MGLGAYMVVAESEMPRVPVVEFSSSEIANDSRKGKYFTKGSCSVPGTNLDLWYTVKRLSGLMARLEL